jgi:hypothetical protein
VTQKNDNKRGGPDNGNSWSGKDGYGDKVERRFTKEAQAKTGNDGAIRGDKMGRDHKDNTGGQGH